MSHIFSVEQLNVVPLDFSLHIVKFCCCKVSYSQCFLSWTYIAWPKVSHGAKREEEEEAQAGPRLFFEQFPRGILFPREVVKAGTSVDPLHLHPDSGCHGSKLKFMPRKLFRN